MPRLDTDHSFSLSDGAPIWSPEIVNLAGLRAALAINDESAVVWKHTSDSTPRPSHYVKPVASPRPHALKSRLAAIRQLISMHDLRTRRADAALIALGISPLARRSRRV